MSSTCRRSRGPSRTQSRSTAPGRSTSRHRSRPSPTAILCSRCCRAEGVTAGAQNPNTGGRSSPSCCSALARGSCYAAVLLLGAQGRFGGAGGGLMSFGRSRARRVEARTAGHLRGCRRHRRGKGGAARDRRLPPGARQILGAGGEDPARVLLSGPPGTGKTLLAKAVAGEAAFRSSDVGLRVRRMIVGVGASRVRDLFAQAKAASPAIIFIDELDAIGRSRASAGRTLRVATTSASRAESDPDRNGWIRPARRRDRARRHQPSRDPRSRTAAPRSL